MAVECGVRHLEVEGICSDSSVHRARLEGRASDIPGLVLPTWGEVRALVG
ncbi:MAG: hypothetical protein ABR551_07445 [Gemmatimonadales bacterium]